MCILAIKNTMAKTTQSFSLPEEAIGSLNDLLHKGVHAARKLNRARILLQLDQGLTPAQVADQVGVCTATVYNIRRKALTQGWQAALEEEQRAGRPVRLSAQTKAEITALACSDPPEGYARWSLRLLADRAVEFGFVERITHEGIREILKKTNLNLT